MTHYGQIQGANGDLVSVDGRVSTAVTTAAISATTILTTPPSIDGQWYKVDVFIRVDTAGTQGDYDVNIIFTDDGDTITKALIEGAQPAVLGANTLLHGSAMIPADENTNIRYSIDADGSPDGAADVGITITRVK